ncbi:MAG: hypothetical protein CMF22_05435 [Idiomarinaceae bacterium]|nr:hypothetical protein [Idiomarinaceae bacterium]|tara:strand:- start:1207 stop:1956 length:750 start_codon:yes stop_codon:yes gene_type:complete
MITRNNWVIAGILILLLPLTACSKVGMNAYNNKPRDFFEDPLVIKMAVLAMEGNEHAVSELMKKGVNINHQGKDGMTPLLWVLGENSEQGFGLLLKLGANPNLPVDSRGNAMTFSASADNPAYLKMALENGGDANYFHPQRKRNVIFDAISPGHLEHVKLLIKHGAEINTQDGTGGTPLLAAASLNQYDIVYHLLEQGADFRIGNRWGKTIKDRIENNNISKSSELYQWRSKVIEYLEQNGVNVSPRVK